MHNQRILLILISIVSFLMIGFTKGTNIIIFGDVPVGETYIGDVSVLELRGYYESTDEMDNIFEQKQPSHLAGWNRLTRHNGAETIWAVRTAKDAPDKYPSVLIAMDLTVTTTTDGLIILMSTENPSYGLPMSIVTTEKIKAASFEYTSYLPISNTLSSEKAQKVCNSLDGFLAAPVTIQSREHITVEISKDNTSVWTGIGRTSSQDTWKWQENEDTLQVYEVAYELNTEADASGCLALTAEGAFQPVNCSRSMPFVCESGRYFFRSSQWLKFYSAKRSFDEAAAICARERNGGHLVDSVLWSPFFRLIWTKSSVNELYWTGIRKNITLQKYTFKNGEPLTGNSKWGEGEPSGLGDCVATTKSEWSSQPCNSSLPFICQFIRPQDSSFKHKNKFHLVPLDALNFQNASDLCSQYNQHPFLVDDEHDLAQEFRLPYAKDTKHDKFWLPFVDPLKFSKLFSNQQDEANGCSILVVEPNLPHLAWVPCTSTAGVICTDPDIRKLVEPVTFSYCPDGFEVYADDSCFATTSTATMWPIAQATCSKWGSLAYLEDDKTKHNVLVGLFATLRGLNNPWTGMCGQDSTQLRLASDMSNASLSQETSVANGNCAVLRPSNETAQEWVSMQPYSLKTTFICQAEHRNESWDSSLTISEALEESTALLSADFCQSGHIPYAGKEGCYSFTTTTGSWSAACNVLATFESQDEHSSLVSVLATYKWLISDKLWIGLSSEGEGLHWVSGEPVTHTAFSETSQPPQGSFCVAVDLDGVWHAEDCSAKLPSLCASVECWTGSPQTYLGRRSETLSGFKCQEWSAHSPHTHHFPAEQHDQCRAFDGYFAPFCITQQPLLTFEACNVPRCGQPFKRTGDHWLDMTVVSEWMVNDVGVTCPSNHWLTDCRCRNEHCFGIRISDETPESCVMHFRPNPDGYNVQDKGVVFCRPLLESQIYTRSVVKLHGGFNTALCPTIQRCVGCFGLDVSAEKPRSDFGSLIRGSQSCMVESTSETEAGTAVCLASHTVGRHQAGYSQIMDTGALEFPLTDTLSYVTLTRTAISTLCLWISAEKIGTLMYFAEDGLRPLLAVAESDSGSEAGLFLTPDGAATPFDAGLLTGGQWRHVCAVTGWQDEQDQHSRCLLYVDGTAVARTSGNSPCTLAGFKGHVAVGSGRAFAPTLRHRNGSTFWAEHDQEGRSGNTSAAFDLQYVGLLGPITGAAEPLSQQQVIASKFSCLLNEEESPSFVNLLSEASSFNGVGELKKLYNVQPCQSSVNQYSVAIDLTIEKSDDDFILTSVLNYDATKLSTVAETILYKSVYQRSGSSSVYDVGQQTIDLTSSENDPIVMKLFGVKDGKVYTFNVTASIQSILLPDLPATTVTRVVVTAPGVPASIQSAVPPEAGELLPGTDLLEWSKPVEGDADEYKLDVFTFNNESQPSLLYRAIVEGGSPIVEYLVGLGNASSQIEPGRPYMAEVRSVFRGLDGPVARLHSQVMPEAPFIVALRNLTTQSKVTTGLSVQWAIENYKYLDAIFLNIRESSSLVTSQHRMDAHVTNHHLLDLEPLTEYVLELVSVAGEKNSSGGYQRTLTGFSGSLTLAVKRIAPESVEITWEVDSDCHQFVVSNQVTASIQGSRSTAACSAASTREAQTVTRLCDVHTRLFVKEMAANMSVAVKGCLYHTTVQLYKLGHPDFVASETVHKYDVPAPLLVVDELRVESQGESELQVSWSDPDPAEKADRFKVSISRAQHSDKPMASHFCTSSPFVFTELTPATLYNITVSSLRASEEGPSLSVTSWTYRNGMNSAFALSSWGVFEKCSASCGNATMKRRRICEDPSGLPSPGKDCNGTSFTEETVPCSELPMCPVHGGWTPWSENTPCTETCGFTGSTTRNRSCTNPEPLHGGTPCAVNKTYGVDVQTCPNTDCPVLGVWSTWSSRYACSASCGNGTLLRTRSCENKGTEPTTGSPPFCPGENEKFVNCFEQKCPVDGQWSKWSPWIPAVIPCGARNSTRVRTCSSPPPSDGGKLCGTNLQEKETEEKRLLGLQPCSSDWVWGKWTLFTQCSATCGDSPGVRTRVRRCHWVDHEFAGKVPCTESEEQTVQCPNRECPIHGKWGSWHPWSPCSQSCGRGVRFRIRICDDPAPWGNGKTCEEEDERESSFQEEICDLHECPLDRYRSSEWSAPHCSGERSARTKIWWTLEHSGRTQNQSCPPGSSGIVWRKCSQNQQWMKEDLSDCVVAPIRAIADFVDASSASPNAFVEATDRLLLLLAADHEGEELNSAGDLVALQGILSKLLSWHPFTFQGALRNTKFTYLDRMTSLVQHTLRLKYAPLWDDFDVPSLLNMMTTMFSNVDNATRGALGLLDPASFDSYQTSFSSEMHLALKAFSDQQSAVRYPGTDSPHLSRDGSFIEIPAEAFSEINNNNNIIEDKDASTNFSSSSSSHYSSLLQEESYVSFVKYDDPEEILSSLPITLFPSDSREESFEGRKLNSALLGAQLLHGNGRKAAHRINGHVYITFYHKRKPKNPKCVFVDLKSTSGLFNDDGCSLWRLRAERTICRCNHLTTFALLSHDYENDEYLRRQITADFRTLMTYTCYACLAIYGLSTFLVFYPTTIPIQRTFITLNTLFAVLFRYVVLAVSFLMESSDIICLATLALYVYFCTVGCTCGCLRLLDVYVKINTPEDNKKRPNFSLMSWGHSLLAPANVAAIYLLYDSQHGAHDRFQLVCADLFSPGVIAVAMTCYLCVAIISLMLLACDCRGFYRNDWLIKPKDAIRIERQLWLGGFGAVFDIISVAMSLPILVYTTTAPDVIYQTCFVAAALFASLYTFFNEIWMNLEIRAFYRRKIGFPTPVHLIRPESKK